MLMRLTPDTCVHMASCLWFVAGHAATKVLDQFWVQNSTALQESFEHNVVQPLVMKLRLSDKGLKAFLPVTGHELDEFSR